MAQRLQNQSHCPGKGKVWDLETHQEKVVQPLGGLKSRTGACRGPWAGRDTLVARSIPSGLLFFEVLSSAACIKSFSSSKPPGVYDERTIPPSPNQIVQA